MAWSTVETKIANPATGRNRKRKKNMARRMSLKQKLHFGSKRVRTAAKQALKACHRTIGDRMALLRNRLIGQTDEVLRVLEETVGGFGSNFGSDGTVTECRHYRLRAPRVDG